MEKEFVSYDQALALKELGFDESCFGCYDEKGVFGLTVMSIKQYYINIKEDTWNCSAPLYQQVFRWFREIHNIDFAVLEKYKDLGKFYGGYVNQNDVRISFGSDFKTYEEAENACIDKLIEIIKQK